MGTTETDATHGSVEELEQQHLTSPRRSVSNKKLSIDLFLSSLLSIHQNIWNRLFGEGTKK